MAKMRRTEMLHYLMNVGYETNLGFVLHNVRAVRVDGRNVDFEQPQTIRMPDRFGRLVLLKVLPKCRLVVIAKFHLTNTITVARRGKVLAMIEFSGNRFKINGAYTVQNQEILQRKVPTPAELRNVANSSFLHVTLGAACGVDISRLDMSTGREPHCAAFFGMNRLLSVTYHGGPTHDAIEDLLCQALMRRDRQTRTTETQTEIEIKSTKCQTDDVLWVEVEGVLENARDRQKFLGEQLMNIGTDFEDGCIEGEDKMVPALLMLFVVFLLRLYTMFLFFIFRTAFDDDEKSGVLNGYTYANGSTTCGVLGPFY